MAALTIDDSTLTDAARDAAARLAGRRWAEEAYLAGSGALALYAGHRRIGHLDLMTPTDRLASADRRRLLADLVEMDPETRVETARNGFLSLRLGSGVGVKLYYYPYPLAEPTREWRGLAVASPLDLGLMKLGAIISRATRRDFVDLYLLCRRLPLEEILDRSADKLGHVRDFPLQALKGLADLTLADDEPMPSLTEPLDWREVESWLGGEVKRLGRRYVGLDDAAAASGGERIEAR